MRTKPKDDQVMWWLNFYHCPDSGYEITVIYGTIDDRNTMEDTGFNCFKTRKQAEEARIRIIEILKGEEK